VEHVVFWPARAGPPAVAPRASLEAAVSTVEMLRNDEASSAPRCTRSWRSR